MSRSDDAPPAALPVGINVSSVPVEALGAGQYVVELVRAADKLDVLALTLFTRRDDAERWRAVAPLAQVLAVAPSGRPARVAWESLGLAAAARRPTGRDRLQVLHGPHYSLPPWSGLPGVVTVHDLTFVDHPEWHERSKTLYFRRALRIAARRAAVVVCVSQRTAARFEELYPKSAPVVVVPHGVDHARFRPAEPSAGADAAVLDRLGVREPYVLHTGTIQPRKDLATLVAAFDRIAGARQELCLVLSGGSGWATSTLDAAVSFSPHRARILRLGHVDDGDVPSLVRRAAVAAYPSLEEGFGLPALEALACGTPLVTTEDSTMSDLAGGAALLVPRSDPEALASALDVALLGGPEVTRARAAGIEIAGAHTWHSCALGHLDAYRIAADR